MSSKKSFTIDRSFWRRGAGRLDSEGINSPHGRTELRNKNGNACCLGHIAQQCGVTWSALTGVSLPSGLFGASRALLDGVLTDSLFDKLPNPKIVVMAAGINDSSAISDAEREEKLAELFAKSGIALTFHGEYLGGYLASLNEERRSE